MLLRHVPGGGHPHRAYLRPHPVGPRSLPNPRAVGCYLGLRPRQTDLGNLSPKLHITKDGDEILRRPLVPSWHRMRRAAGCVACGACAPAAKARLCATPRAYGMKQPRWINEIELVDQHVDGYWVTRDWNRQATMKATSVIDIVAVDGIVEHNVSRYVPVSGTAHADTSLSVDLPALAPVEPCRLASNRYGRQNHPEQPSRTRLGHRVPGRCSRPRLPRHFLRVRGKRVLVQREGPQREGRQTAGLPSRVPCCDERRSSGRPNHWLWRGLRPRPRRRSGCHSNPPGRHRWHHCRCRARRGSCCHC